MTKYTTQQCVSVTAIRQAMQYNEFINNWNTSENKAHGLRDIL